MSALSTYLENAILNHLLTNTAYTRPDTLYFALFTSDPGSSGVTGELSGGGYARVAVTNNNINFPQCNASGTPTKTNGSTIQFPTASAAWGNVSHWAIYDAATTGTNMLMHGALNTVRYVAAGDAPKIVANALSITITNATSGGLTDYAKRKVLDHVFGGPNFASPTTAYVGIGTYLSAESFTEWTESSYARRAIAFGSASGGVSANSGTVTFTSSVVDGSSTLNSLAIYDNADSALVFLPASTTRTVNIGDAATIAASGITVTLQ